MYALAIVAVVLLLLFGLASRLAVPFDIIVNLLFGWAIFPGTVVPRLSVNGMGVLSGVLCLAALAAGLHYFLRWFAAHLPTPSAWPLRWTLTMLGVFVLMFVAGISAIGVTHQTAWLLTAPEPLVQWSRGSTNNLKQIGLALHMHQDAYDKFPAGATFDRHGRMLHGWQTQILPFIEMGHLYQRIKLDLPWDHPDNAPHFRTIIRMYLFPNTRGEAPTNAAGLALTHYAGNARVLGGDEPWTLERLVAADGTANTLLAGEVAENYKPWGYPANWRDPAKGLNRAPDGFGSPMKHGVVFLFGDGTVRTLNNSISPEVLKALSTPDGGEKVEVP